MNLTGTLEEFKLPDLFRIIEQINKNGVLQLQLNSEEGQIYFYNSEIVHAKCNNWEGEKALYYFFTWETGNFTFLVQEYNVTKTINKTLLELIDTGIKYLETWNSIDVKSIIYLQDLSNKNISDKEKYILEILKSNNGEIVLYDLFYKSNIEPQELKKLIGNLVENKSIKLVSDSCLKLQTIFEGAITTLWEEFLAISGWKLINELTNKFEELNTQHNWNFILENGKIKDKTKVYQCGIKQRELYSNLWKEITQIIEQIHGKTFIEKVINKIKNNLSPNEIILLNDIF